MHMTVGYYLHLLLKWEDLLEWALYVQWMNEWNFIVTPLRQQAMVDPWDTIANYRSWVKGACIYKVWYRERERERERERGERERGGGEGPGRTEEDIRKCFFLYFLIIFCADEGSNTVQYLYLLCNLCSWRVKLSTNSRCYAICADKDNLVQMIFGVKHSTIFVITGN